MEDENIAIVIEQKGNWLKRFDVSELSHVEFDFVSKILCITLSEKSLIKEVAVKMEDVKMEDD